MDNTGMIRALLRAGLIAKLAHTAIMLVIWYFQKPILRITSRGIFDDMDRTGFLPLMLIPLLSLGVSILLFYLLKTHLDTNAAAANAGILLGAAIGAPILLNAVSVLFSLFCNGFIARIYGTAEFGLISTVSSYMGWFSFLSTFAMLSTAAAAGMLWWRARHADPL